MGDVFTVADLTAATLFYPVVRPPEGPQVVPRHPAGIRAFIESIEDRPGYRWVQETFRRHRAPAVVRPS